MPSRPFSKRCVSRFQRARWMDVGWWLSIHSFMCSSSSGRRRVYRRQKPKRRPRRAHVSPVAVERRKTLGEERRVSGLLEAQRWASGSLGFKGPQWNVTFVTSAP